MVEKNHTNLLKKPFKILKVSNNQITVEVNLSENEAFPYLKQPSRSERRIANKLNHKPQ